jgi:metal-dependent amidase/aminoacylase/carboxypeptidase family protein
LWGYSREATVQIVQQIAEFHDQLTEWRRDIHAHPELGFEEQRTSDLVAQRLAEFGYEVFRGIGKTGVVGRLRAGSSSRSIIAIVSELNVRAVPRIKAVSGITL